jgi:nucleoside-diphosphate-sugar epimerase
MRVLVIGGTGFIGAPVVRRLQALGGEVTVLHRGRAAAALPPGVRSLLGDRAALPARRAELRRLAPAVVLDMIAMTAADARATLAAVDGLAERLVVISSADVYRAQARLHRREPGPPDPVPLTETAPLRATRYPERGPTPRPPDDPQRWLDDYDKLLVEAAVQGAAGLAVTILRLPAVYGPGDAQHRLFGYLKRMDDGRPAILLDAGLAGWRWTRGYVENVAAAIALVVLDGRAAGRVYNAGETPALTEAAWVRAIGAATGWRGAVVALPPARLPAHLATPLATEQDWVLDTRRLRAELGFAEPVAFAEGLRRTVAWQRAHPPAALDPARFAYAAEDAALAAGGWTALPG